MIRALCEGITTLHRIYSDHDRTPEVHAPMRAFDGAVMDGDRVTLHDDHGNEVECTVRRLDVVVVPDWDTFRSRENAGQETML